MADSNYTGLVGENPLQTLENVRNAANLLAAVDFEGLPNGADTRIHKISDALDHEIARHRHGRGV
jgi:hypothetical protein